MERRVDGIVNATTQEYRHGTTNENGKHHRNVLNNNNNHNNRHVVCSGLGNRH